jgi:hypothetical protein
MNIQIKYESWWRDIENLDLHVLVKDELKAAISSFYNQTLPPTLTETVARLMRESGISNILIEKGRDEIDYLEITQFVPFDIDKHRNFLYLRPFYPNGNSIPFTANRQWLN